MVNTSRTIDYWGIVTRSARIAWTHKFLWFFGFFAASGGGGSGNYSSVGERGAEEIRSFFMTHIEILVLIIIGVVVLWLILLVLNVISKGALLSCISRADHGEPVSFSGGWNEGLKHFWGMLGIGLLGLLVFLVVSFVCVVAVVIPIAGGAPGIAVAVVIAPLLFVPYVAFAFLLAFTIIYAEREYVIGDATVSDALATGWGMTRAYFLQSFLMWLVAFGSTMAFVIAILICLLAISVPFILIGVASPTAGLVLGIPVGIVFMILAVSAYSTYDHSLWTLMYAELRPEDSSAPAVVEPTPPPPSPTPARPAFVPESTTPESEKRVDKWRESLEEGRDDEQ